MQTISKEEVQARLAQPRRYLSIPKTPHDGWGSVKQHCDASYHSDTSEVAFYHAYKIACKRRRLAYDEDKLPDMYRDFLSIRENPNIMFLEQGRHCISNYYHLAADDLVHDIETIISTGLPVLAMLKIHRSFNTCRSVTVKIPDPVFWDEPNDPQDPVLGSIMLCLVGYYTEKQMFTAQHSIGQYWGSGGFCYIPYQYVTNPHLGLEFFVLDV